jgi:hypothetical protein
MKNNSPAARSPRKKSAPLNDAELEQWLAEALDAPVSQRTSRDPQTKAILSIVDRVRDTLVPIQPSPRFVRELGYRLVDTAGRGKQSLIRRYRTAIVIGVAAAGSLASAVGVAALLLRQKNRRTARSV